MKTPSSRLVLLAGVAVAAPTTTSGNALAIITSSINSVYTKSAAAPTITSLLKNVQPTATPTSPADFAAKMQSVGQANNSNIYDYIANLRSFNLIDSFESFASFGAGFFTGDNSVTNVNPDPPYRIYPKYYSCDAPYMMTEKQLRQVIRIPSTFTYGKKLPVILMPGSGNTGYTSFKGNFIKLLQASNKYDPVWINDPKLLLDDVQNNAEYSAYAMNYIAAITKRKDVAVVSWSQGGIDVHWATKYWPSTRNSTIDHVTLSTLFSGTINANFITPPGLPQPKAVIQQRYLYTSQFITTLRSNGGDSAYIPTTSIWTAFADEIVQPQVSPGASAQINDARNVGVSNNQIQTICGATPGGSYYSHEGVMYSSLAYALFQDAVSNTGPGQASRLDLATVCSTYLAPGLNVADALITENSIPTAGFFIITDPDRVVTEPPIRSFARSPPPTCAA